MTVVRFTTFFAIALALFACTSSKSDASRDAAVDAPSIDAATDAPLSALDAAVDAPPEASAPRCDAGVYSADAGGCVECVTSTDCTSGVCDTEHHECVQCNETSDCTDALCNTATHQCVQCLTHANCSATTPVCGATGMCEGCTTRTQCDRFAGTTPACQTSTGQCKACDPSAETATTAGDCGGNSCNPDSWSCTGTPRGMTSSCSPCVADSECSMSVSGTRRCVEVSYLGTSHGRYCQVDRATASGSICPARFTRAASLVSRGGVSATYCLPRDSTTCEAVLDFLAPCSPSGEIECGDNALSDDGLCRDDGDGNLCTHACSTNLDCQQNYVCLTGESPSYCKTVEGGGSPDGGV